MAHNRVQKDFGLETLLLAHLHVQSLITTLVLVGLETL